MRALNTFVVPILCGTFGLASAQQGSFQTKSLTPETALAAGKAALESCRGSGFQVAVAVVDRAGLVQVLLRDRFAGAHTIEVATNKAWTAASFRTSTSALAAETQAGKAMSGLRGLPRFLAAGGGILIEGGGSSYGAIGVSGAPGGEADEACAQAGLKAISDAIDFSTARSGGATPTGLHGSTSRSSCCGTTRPRPRSAEPSGGRSLQQGRRRRLSRRLQVIVANLSPLSRGAPASHRQWYCSALPSTSAMCRSSGPKLLTIIRNWPAMPMQMPPAFSIRSAYWSMASVGVACRRAS